jgi:hypothetical protein
MEFFLKQPSDGEEDFAEFLYRNFYKLQRNNRIAVITEKITDNLFRNISRIKNYGYSMIIFYSIEGEGHEEKLRRLNNLGVDCIKAR